MFFQFDLRKILALIAVLSLPVVLFNIENSLQKLASPFLEVSHGVQRGLNYLSLGVFESVNLYTNLISIKSQNKDLLKEVSKLKIEQVLYKEIKLENDRLKDLLELKKNSNMVLSAAVLSSKDILLNGKTLTLSKGSEDGIKKNMGVIGLNGVVGETIKVSKNRSQIIIITNHFFASEGTVQRSRDTIIVEGSGDKLLLAKHLSTNTDIQEGDLIVTSGASGVFPKGLPIGIVKSVIQTKSGITQQAEIKPLVDLQNTEEFYIIQDTGQQI